MPPRDDESELVRRLRAADPAAFAELVRRDGALLRAVARRQLDNDALADEVVQDAWLALLEGLDRFEGRSTLRTWLVRVTLNLACTAARRRVGGHGPAGSPDAAGTLAALASTRPWDDPERRLIALEDRRRLRTAFGALSPTQRLVVALRDVEGFTSEEVGHLLDLTPGQQRVLLHRGRRRAAAGLEHPRAA